MSQLFVDDVVSKEGTNSVGFSKGISVSVASTFSGDVSIGGTLTYEDVTNIDVVGLITARGGIKLGVAGIGGTFNANGDTTLAGVVTATSFVGGLTGAASQITVADESSDAACNVVFTTAATGDLPPKTGTNLTFNSSSGALTASSFVGDGSGLTNLVGTGVTNNVNTVNLNVISGISTFGGDVSIADKIIHTGDTNTALRFPSADTITAETAGTERLRITSDGKYYFTGTGAGSGARGLEIDTESVGAADEGVILNARASGTTGRIKLQTNSATAMTILGNGGNIGIGTDIPATSLHVYKDGATVALIESIGANDSRVRIKAPSDRISYLEFADDDADAGEIRYDHSSNYMGFHVNNNVERLRITSTGNVEVVGLTSTASLTVGPGLIQEEFDSYASALTGTYNHDVVDHGMILYAYSNASASFVLNLRGDGSTTLNSLMNIGQSSVFTAYTGSNNTSYYMTDFQIDGSSQTEEWNGASAPSAGTGSGYDVYTFNILKNKNRCSPCSHWVEVLLVI